MKRTLEARLRRIEASRCNQDVPRVLVVPDPALKAEMVAKWRQKYGHLVPDDGAPSLIVIDLRNRKTPLPRGPAYRDPL